MTVYMFIDIDNDDHEAPYDSETDTPDDVIDRLGFKNAPDGVKDALREIVNHVAVGQDDKILDSLNLLGLEVYDREHPEDLFDYRGHTD